MIDYRLKASRWERVLPGVYRLSGAPATWRQRLLAACLAAGAAGVASHQAAGAVHDLPGGDDTCLEVSVPNAKRVRVRGITVHHVADLKPADLTIVDAIPVTTAMRTLIDLASVLSMELLEEALDEALRRRLTSVGQLRWRLRQLGTRGRTGAGVLAKLMDARSIRALAESPLETRLLRLLRGAKLPIPSSQYEIRGDGRLLARVDFAYPEARLAIEVDGYRWHSGRQRWQRDLTRRNALTALGWRVVHVTSTDLDQRPGEIVAMIAGALASRDSAR